MNKYQKFFILECIIAIICFILLFMVQRMDIKKAEPLFNPEKVVNSSETNSDNNENNNSIIKTVIISGICITVVGLGIADIIICRCPHCGRRLHFRIYNIGDRYCTKCGKSIE